MLKRGCFRLQCLLLGDSGEQFENYCVGLTVVPMVAVLLVPKGQFAFVIPGLHCRVVSARKPWRMTHAKT